MDKLFVAEFDNGKLKVGSKSDIEEELKYYEESGLELPFKTLGFIDEKEEVFFYNKIEGRSYSRTYLKAKEALKNYKTYGW